MARMNLDGARLDNVIMGAGNKRLSMKQTLAGDFTLTTRFPNLLFLDPNGAHRDVLLPPEADSLGLDFEIINIAAGAFNLVVKEDSDTTTIATVGQNESAKFVCDGTTWRIITYVA